MRDKLESMLGTYQELTERLGDPEVLGDQKAYARLAKEHAAMAPLATKITDYFGVLDGCDGVAIHYHRTPLYNSLFRFDAEMLVTPHLYGMPGYAAPLLHLRRKGGQGMFDGVAAHFEAVWATSVPAPPLPQPAPAR